jgi:hypothetical protein
VSDALGIAQPQRVSFAQMFAGRYFVIPQYQRHYAWTTRQCQELFEDCVMTARNPGHERFMSTITTIAPAGNSIYITCTDQSYAQLRPLLVVDGQQRLTSILILISCICRQLNNTAARNAYANLASTPLSDGNVLLRVIPQSIPAHPELMRHFFSGLIALDNNDKNRGGEILIPAQRRLLQARTTFEEGLRRLDDPEFPIEERVSPADLLTCVASRLIFILNTLSDVGQAGEVFEGLNNRGLGLSAIENLKAFSIYAVQSFRRGEVLPGRIEETASDLNDDFNDAIGSIYHRLDKVALPDDTAKDLLSSYWPLVITRVEEAGLSKDGGPPEHLNRNTPVDDIRASLSIQKARSDHQRATLLETLRFMVCERLVPASGYFADARRPTHELSFATINLPPEQMNELKGLHQRLVEMQCSAPFLPLMIAHRVMLPDNFGDYLLLVRLIERVAFWVYGLGERNKGAGQKELARLARDFVDKTINFAKLLLSLRSFAFSNGHRIDYDLDLQDYSNLDERVESHLESNKPSVWAAFAYEWLISKPVELPSYGKFVRCVVDGKYLRIVPGGRGRLPAGYDLDKSDMNHPGNIVVTRLMRNINNNQLNEINGLPYQDKRIKLNEYGYCVSLPNAGLTTAWANRQRASIAALAKQRWAIPDDARISEATISIIADQEVEDWPEDQDD